MPYVHRLLATVLTALLYQPYHSARAYGGCTDGIRCAQVHANGLTFDCRFGGYNHTADGGKDGGKGNVLLLHGFPEWSDMYSSLMRLLGQEGYRSVACNQRGYSPGAAPEGAQSYDYSLLASDVWAVADAVNFTAANAAAPGAGKFHLIGHDHGALLGWVCAASTRGQERLASYTALSIPHAAAFSEGLFGPRADVAQQIASQYFTVFTLPNSSSIHHQLLYRTIGWTSGDADSGRFASAAAFQKALWWYNGALAAGVMGLPPLMSAAQLLAKGSVSMAALRGIYGGTPNNGSAALHPVGNVSVPALYVCGNQDSAILCSQPFALRTREYCSGGYTYAEVRCGHDLLACAAAAETAKVEAAIVAHLHAASSPPAAPNRPADHAKIVESR